MGRLIVFGMDGADPDLLFGWADRLPNLRRLMTHGAYGRLASTTHPLTPQAWTTMLTGVNAGRHGIVDFGARRAGSYDIDLVTSRDRRFPTVFETLPENLRAGVMNVPLSFPVDPIHGFAVGGMHTPTMDTPGAVHPPELRARLSGYVIDVMVHWYEQVERFVADVHAMLDARHEACLRLFDEESPDVFMPVYVALDRVQHALWHEMTDAHRREPGTHGGLGDEIFRVTKKLDECLGDYLARLGPKDHLLLVSDHGFGDLKGDVYLNAWLAREGYLAFDPAKVRAYVPPQAEASDDPRHAWHRDLLPGDPAPLPESDDDIRAGRMDPRYKAWATVDWTRTRAFAAGLFGHVWINVRGREAAGCVEPGAEYESLCDELVAKLRELKHPEDGAALVSMAERRDELFWGAELARVPDILVAFRDYQYITRGATEFLSDELVGPVVVGHTGNHRMHGVVGLFGPRAAKGEAADSEIAQIAPTISYLLDAPIPSNLDGEIARAILRPEALAEHPPVPGPPAAPRVSSSGSPSSDTDMSAVVRRLQGLGYLG